VKTDHLMASAPGPDVEWSFCREITDTTTVS
jgi:hypothetical protein